MRWVAVWVVFACACDRALGLAPSALADAAPFMPDARPTCPTNGPPAFRPTLFRPIVQPCTQYTLAVDAGRALARCGDPFGGNYAVAEGTIDGMLNTAAGFNLDQVNQVAVTPDGTSAIVFGLPTGQSVVSHLRYDRNADGSWSFVHTLPMFDTYFQLSPPSRGATPHLLAVGGTQLDEYIGGPGDTWQLFHRYSTTELGADNTISNITFTADGLRMLFVDEIVSTSGGAPAMRYVHRDDINVPFGVAVRAPDLDSYAAQLNMTSDGAYMTEDCGRLYFAAIESIIYIEQ